jgi:hypothetical protein
MSKKIRQLLKPGRLGHSRFDDASGKGLTIAGDEMILIDHGSDFYRRKFTVRARKPDLLGRAGQQRRGRGERIVGSGSSIAIGQPFKDPSNRRPSMRIVE